MARTRWTFGLLAIGCALLMPLAAEAAFSNGFAVSSDGASQAFQTPANNSVYPVVAPNAFWNNSSFDTTAAPGCNVGFVLTRSGTLTGCNGASGSGKNIGSPLTALTFLGNGPNNAAHLSFISPGIGTTFVFTDTAQTAGDALYWYDTLNGAPPADAAHLIFTAGTAVGTTATISGLPASWGLLLVTGESGSPHYLSNGAGFGQFALFLQNNGQYYAGMEDLNITGGDRDYQDMVIQFAPVPEPATMFLGGLGLIAFGYAARRRLFGK